jgi:hypothetical protein
MWPFLPLYSPLSRHDGQVFLGLPDITIVQNPHANSANHEKQNAIGCAGYRPFMHVTGHDGLFLAHSIIHNGKQKTEAQHSQKWWSDLWQDWENGHTCMSTYDWHIHVLRIHANHLCLYNPQIYTMVCWDIQTDGVTKHQQQGSGT